MSPSSNADLFATNKTRSFINNQGGQILQKTENGQTQNFFYANGNPVGSSGIVDASGNLVANADFDYNYTPVSDKYPGSTPGSYSVAQGDTLRGIALTLFGDASLWHLIADANGLRQDSDLIVGKTLVIPNKITNLRNSYDVHKPYQPGEIIGDTTPTLPDPPPPPVNEDDGCGVFGQILVIIVAVVVTYFTAGALTTAIGPWTGAVLGAAAGSIASQGVAMAIGMQDKFDWGAVGVAALTAGVTKGIGGGIGGTGPVDLAVRAAVSNVATQGINIIVGRQESFDWKSLAVAAITAPLAKMASDKLGGGIDKAFNPDTNKFANDFARNMVGGVVRGAVSMAVYDSGKYDWANVAADAFGNALGNAVAPKPSLAKQGMGLKLGKGGIGLRGTQAAMDAFDSGLQLGQRPFEAPTDTPNFSPDYGLVESGMPLPKLNAMSEPRGDSSEANSMIPNMAADIADARRQAAFNRAVNDPHATRISDSAPAPERLPDDISGANAIPVLKTGDGPFTHRGITMRAIEGVFAQHHGFSLPFGWGAGSVRIPAQDYPSASQLDALSVGLEWPDLPTAEQDRIDISLLQLLGGVAGSKRKIFDPGFQSHRGSNSIWHSMIESGRYTNQQVVDKIITQAQQWYDAASTAMTKGIPELAYFHLGKLLHMMQDSYSASHVFRNASGEVAMFQNYNEQGIFRHNLADSGFERSPWVGTAVNSTMQVLELFRARSDFKAVGDFLRDSVYRLQSGTAGDRAGGTAPAYMKPKPEPYIYRYDHTQFM